MLRAFYTVSSFNLHNGHISRVLLAHFTDREREIRECKSAK